MSYAKGDTFWVCLTTSYREVRVDPRPIRGTVTGGGDQVVIYRMDGDYRDSRETRYRFEKRVHSTREVAIAAGLEELRWARTYHARQVELADEGIASLEAML